MKKTELKDVISSEMKKIEKLNLWATSEELAELNYILDKKYNFDVENNIEKIDSIITELYWVNFIW